MALAPVMDGGVIIVGVGYSGKIHVPWRNPFFFVPLDTSIKNEVGFFFFFLPCVVACAWNPSTQEVET